MADRCLMKYKCHNNAKGMALLIILLLVAMITIIGLGFIVRGDTELLCGKNMELRADMDSLAESGLEHAKGLIMYPQDLAGEYFTGATSQQTYTGPDYYDVNVTKLSECDWQITSLAYRQVSGNRTSRSSLTAKMRLDPDVALWSGTDVVFYPAMNITGDAYSNGAAKNNGILNGDCFADSLAGNAISGQMKVKTDLQLSRPTISSSILTLNFTTQTLGGGNLDKKTLSGYQVYYRNTNFELKQSNIINGCLVIDGNLTVSGISNVINAQKNVPALYVSGKLIIKENATLDCNGLVFVDGRVEMPIANQSMAVRGALFTDDGIRYILPDYSGNGYDGVINGDCLWVAGTPLRGGAINFDGDGDYINIGNPLELNINKKITVAAWIKVTAFDKSYQAIVTKGDTSWRLQRYSNTDYMQFGCSGLSINTSVRGYKPVNDGVWHHVAGVYDGSIIYLYIDGTLDNWQYASGNISTNSASVYIGENSEVTGRCFNGAIDSVRVYKRSFTDRDLEYCLPFCVDK